MTIAIVGAGYVGLVTGACFAEMGNTVICMDNDAERIESLKNGVMPIYEPGLAEMIQHSQAENLICFTTDMEEAMAESSVCFIAVGTPMAEDGGADLRYVWEVAHEIGRHMSRDMVVVDKSTVPVGTADQVLKIIRAELAARDVNFACHVVSNPEFLKEGTAIADCMSPDRVVIGSSNQKTANFVKELYSPFVRESDRFIVMDVRSAEMTKYASNAMLATRISFMNEIACICEAVGADVNLVRLGMGADTRIGYSFLYAGCGYGGSCFPKDVQALVKTARDCGCVSEILTAVESVNRRQKHELAEKVIAHFGEDLSGRIFAIWGLAFKPNTDDMREAPSLTVIRELLEHGASVKTYDPKATDEAKKIFGESVAVEYCDNKYDALEEADAMLLLTEWKEFRSPDFAEMKQRMKTPLVFDGRNQYKAQSLQREGFSYWQVGVRNG